MKAPFSHAVNLFEGGDEIAICRTHSTHFVPLAQLIVLGTLGRIPGNRSGQTAVYE